MTDNASDHKPADDPNAGPNAGPNDDQSMGEPIAALAAMEIPASSGFLQRLRRRIYRRSAGSQVASFTWYMPQMVLREFLLLIGELLNAKSEQRSGKA